MTVGILTEKPSAMRAFAKALGGETGTHNGENYVLAHARGHLYELDEPQNQLIGASGDETSKMKTWNLDGLPWDLDRFEWKYVQMDKVGPLVSEIKRRFAGCDEICLACDVDPTGEGGLIAANIVKAIGMAGKRLSRMYFMDEAPGSLTKAFVGRQPIPDLDHFDEYLMATYRSAFDFGSIQFTRVATLVSGQRDVVLRQGRLKSAMVKLVGDQFKDYSDYVKKPFFQNRFKDENSVLYTNPDEPTFPSADQVPQQYRASAVVLDSRTDKATAPPKLLDLAGLSTLMAKNGLKPAQVLKTYQTLYEAGVVSYPRTEDKTITPEQFKELSPLVDRIAAVVGVDTKLLTHRDARGTHVKTKGAHGANRPGLSVPATLAELSKYGPGAQEIYAALAKNYLAMLADDYRYEQQKGHVKDYPDFTGIANVPQSQGWKLVFDADAGEKDSADENESSKGLGSNAEPFVFEGANKRPEHPSMKWLMKQLEKRDVGTGATRTSTYAEVTNDRAKYPLLTDKRGKLTLATAGEMSWLLLPGTHIGDLGLTEKVHQDMRDIAAGKTTAAQCLQVVADWVREDIATMQTNAAAMQATLGITPQVMSAYAEGTWQNAPGGPKAVKFKKLFAGHEFSDDEIAELLAGQKLSFSAVSKAGKNFTATGQLGLGEYTNKANKKIKYVGFQLEVPNKPTTWCGRTFLPDEVTALLAGQSLSINDFVSAKTGNTFSCKVTWDPVTKKIVPDFGSDDEPPLSWCGVTFTDAQRKELAAGNTIEGKGFVSRKTKKKFDAKITWKDEGGKKKIVPSFK